MGVYPTRERNVRTRGEWEEEGGSPTRFGNCEWSLAEKRNDEGQVEKTEKKGERYSKG